MNVPDWVDGYVGIPFLDGGRTRLGCDCYGLLWLTLREQFNVILPSYENAPSALEREEASAMIAGRLEVDRWVRVTDPRPGDGVLLRVANRPWHVGVVVGPNLFLHVAPGQIYSAVERLDTPRWNRRVIGFYRHEAMRVE